MLHTPTALQSSRQLLHAAKQLQEQAAVLLAQSRVLIAKGKARTSPTHAATGDRSRSSPLRKGMLIRQNICLPTSAKSG
jgi:hypothetical protein